jgi:hypothetical protein
MKILEVVGSVVPEKVRWWEVDCFSVCTRGKNSAVTVLELNFDICVGAGGGEAVCKVSFQ